MEKISVSTPFHSHWSSSLHEYVLNRHRLFLLFFVQRLKLKPKIFSILQNEMDILAFYCHFIRSHPLFLITYYIELTTMFDNDKRALSFICQ